MVQMKYLNVEVDCDALERLLARRDIDVTASYSFANYGSCEPEIKRQLVVNVPLGTPADEINDAVTMLAQ